MEPLPAPRAVLVAAAGDVDELTRAARAELAALTLELQGARLEAERAEEAAADHSRQADTGGAEALVRSATAELAHRRRLERRAAVEQARTEAACRIAAAHVEAERIRAAAGERPPAISRDRSATGAGAFSRRRSTTSGLAHALSVDVALPLAGAFAMVTLVLALMG